MRLQLSHHRPQRDSAYEGAMYAHVESCLREAAATLEQLRGEGFGIWGDGDIGHWLVHTAELIETSDQPRQPDPNKRKPIPQGLRTKVFETDEYRCVKCGSHEDLAVDHILPVAEGGTNDRENLQTLCRSCNSRKGKKIEVAE